VASDEGGGAPESVSEEPLGCSPQRSPKPSAGPEAGLLANPVNGGEWLTAGRAPKNYTGSRAFKMTRIVASRPSIIAVSTTGGSQAASQLTNPHAPLNVSLAICASAQ